MNKIFLSLLLLSIVFLTGCEHSPVNNGNIIPSSESAPTKFSAVKFETPEGNQMENSPSLAVQDIEKLAATWGANTKVISDNFFIDPNQIQAPDIILGTPMDFDNFFADAAVGRQIPDTGTPVGTPMDFDNFFSNQTQTQFHTKKQEKIKAINKKTIVLLKNNTIAEQVRNKDVDTQLEFDLSNLIAKLPVDRKILVQKMQDDLTHKIRLLDADTAIKITDIRMLSIDKSAFALAGVEKKVLSAKSTAEDGVIEHIFATEPDRYYRIREEEKALHVQYIADMKRIKLQSKNSPRLDNLEKDVQAFDAANQKIINTRITELEAQRVVEALIIEAKVKVEHKAIIDALRVKSESSLKEYGDTVEYELAVTEKVVLDQLESQNIKATLSRESQRRADNKQYIREIKKKIQQAQLTHEKKVRDTNIPTRDARVIAIANNLNNSIKYIEASRVQTLASLKAQQEQLHQSKKRSLKASFGAKEQVLIQISKQKELKVLSLFKTENSAILTKENKAIEAINKEINARVHDEIKAELDRFEAFRKEEAAFRKEEAAIRKEETANAKKIRAEKLKESPGFFKSLF